MERDPDPPVNNLEMPAEVDVILLGPDGGADDPVYISSDEEDVGEYEVNRPGFFDFGLLYDSSDDVEEEEEEEEEDWEEDETDSGYESISEDEDEEGDEEGDEEEQEEAEESEEDDQRFPPEEFWDGWRQRDPPAEAEEQPQASVLQQPAGSPSPAFRCLQRFMEEAFGPPTPPPSSPAPSGSTKRILDEEDAEEPSSKRPRLDQDEDGPSTSAGTSSVSGFTRYFHYHLEPEDSDSD